jgi:arabinose-5-phosphate isomerase
MDIDYILNLFLAQKNGVEALASTLTSPSFANLIEFCFTTKGKIITCGVGKSEIVGQKFTAMLNSFGIESVSLPPINAIHGDLGVVRSDDLVIFISNSGVSAELLPVLYFCQSNTVKTALITRSTATKENFSYVLNLPNPPESDEAIPAPTTSTTMFFILTDILALCLAKKHGLSPQGYVKFHPGGKIGASLLQIHTLSKPCDLPLVNHKNLNPDFVAKHLKNGFTILIDESGLFVGYLEVEDLVDFFTGKILDISAAIKTSNVASYNITILEAKNSLKNLECKNVVLLDERGKPCGYVDSQSILNY